MERLHDLEWAMGIALEQADLAYRENEVPIGAVVLDKSGKIISKAYNVKEHNYDPCGHAEILALREACQKLNSWRLIDCDVIVTLEPCPMCLSALQQTRIRTLVFGAYDLKGGAISLRYNMHKDSRLNHQFSVIGGLRHFECSKLLSNFFKEKRETYKTNKKFKET
ncbi:MAG: nucleoside deaminase [Halobacteriovoraceae bacterium]|nr:nucleoside deaminase [Halobacteriovoraceae bacterium]